MNYYVGLGLSVSYNIFCLVLQISFPWV
jgi:hypothetical protein